MTDIPIMNCILIDALWSRAARGDQQALAILRAMGPRDAPLAVRRDHRDAELRRLGRWLQEAIPGIAPYAVAAALHAAGDRLQRGGPFPNGGLFDQLDRAERKQLQDEILQLQAMVSLTWPCLRQCQRILRGSDTSPYCNVRSESLIVEK